jgi:hypothetical protein
MILQEIECNKKIETEGNYITMSLKVSNNITWISANGNTASITEQTAHRHLIGNEVIIMHNLIFNNPLNTSVNLLLVQSLLPAQKLKFHV